MFHIPLRPDDDPPGTIDFAVVDQGICEHGGSLHDCLALHPRPLHRMTPDPED